jgi:hypothetical protein
MFCQKQSPGGALGRVRFLQAFPLPAAEDWCDGKDVALMQLAKKEIAPVDRCRDSMRILTPCID